MPEWWLFIRKYSSTDLFLVALAQLVGSAVPFRVEVDLLLPEIDDFVAGHVPN